MWCSPATITCTNASSRKRGLPTSSPEPAASCAKAMSGDALHTWRRAALPIVAAIGGTIGAIAAYDTFVLAGDEHVLLSGWPIVCAVDGGVAYFLVRVLIGSGGAAPFVVLLAIVSNA